MAKLAIRSHAIRSKEVIELLEMLGGKNIYHFNGDEDEWFVLDSNIQRSDRLFNEISFTLEEFEKRFPYKVGDKVIYTYTSENGIIEKTTWNDRNNAVVYEVKIGERIWITDVKHLQPYKEKTMKEKIQAYEVTEEICANEVAIEFDPSKFEMIERNGKYFVVKKQPQYPKTFIEVLDFWHPNRQLEDDYQRGYKKDLIEKFQDLLYARDAYWNIYGKQMGLGKPWQPNWLNTEQDKFVLYTHNNVICSNRFVLGHNVLAFPTKEMRDAFYENFKETIEQCKELL